MLVYSTGPRSAFGDDNNEYIIKGSDDPGTIAAEAVGYMLASTLQICVPPFAVATTPGGADVFASQKMLTASRDCTPWIKKTRAAIGRILTLDIWLANNDRNIGGLLAEYIEVGRIEIIAIDFEKSQCIREPFALVRLPTLPARTLWPQGELGTMMRNTPFPAQDVAMCRQVSDDTLRAITGSVHEAVPGFTWHQSAADALIWRRDRLDTLVREVWQA